MLWIRCSNGDVGPTLAQQSIGGSHDIQLLATATIRPSHRATSAMVRASHQERARRGEGQGRGKGKIENIERGNLWQKEGWKKLKREIRRYLTWSFLPALPHLQDSRAQRGRSRRWERGSFE